MGLRQGYCYTVALSKPKEQIPATKKKEDTESMDKGIDIAPDKSVRGSGMDSLDRSKPDDSQKIEIDNSEVKSHCKKGEGSSTDKPQASVIKGLNTEPEPRLNEQIGKAVQQIASEQKLLAEEATLSGKNDL